MLGEVQAALDQDEKARAHLATAVKLTRGGYGPSHPNTRRAELSLVLFDLAHADPPVPSMPNALYDQLQALSELPKSDPELRKVAWLAGTAIALERCKEPGFGEGPAMLDAIAAEIEIALPEGGSIARTFERERQRCR
jgi:hypothetical protein